MIDFIFGLLLGAIVILVIMGFRYDFVPRGTIVRLAIALGMPSGFPEDVPHIFPHKFHYGAHIAILKDIDDMIKRAEELRTKFEKAGENS